MPLGFRKFISEVFMNGKFLKILPSENFPLYGICVLDCIKLNKLIISKIQVLQMLCLKHHVYKLHKLSWIRNQQNTQKF